MLIESVIGGSMNSPDIRFPHLGIEIQSINPVAFTLFGVPVYWYGIIIACGIMAGAMLASYRAKRSGQNPEIYMDYLIYALISAILGARIYYVLNAWDEYKGQWLEVFNIRGGGLAIYGGVIGAVIALVIYTRIKHLDFRVLADTAAPGLILGQIIGRMGNFMNMEAFGSYSDGVFAMMIKESAAKYVPDQLLDKLQYINGVAYIQVHPTFLYEMIWNMIILTIMLIASKHQKFKGQIIAMYFLGYGLGRVWIEGLRTDQLILPGTPFAISQLLSGILIVASSIYLIVNLKKSRNSLH